MTKPTAAELAASLCETFWLLQANCPAQAFGVLLRVPTSVAEMLAVDMARRGAEQKKGGRQ